MPETITINGSEANTAAVRSDNKEHRTTIAIRQVKYLNTIVEQDQCGVKRVIHPMLGFTSFDVAQCTLAGIELMHMSRKGYLGGAEQGLMPAEQFYSLAT